jgi:ABC-2 type transport system permease protein
VFGAVSTAYITHTSSLVAARQTGVLKRWRATPLPPACFLGARIAATTLLATAGGMLTALAGGADYHIHTSPGTLASLLLVLLLGAAAWASIGTAVSAMIPTVEAAWPILGVTYMPIVVLSGGFGVVGTEPGWLATIIGWLPVQPIVHSATLALHSGSGDSTLSAHDLAVLAAWAAAGLLVAQRWFYWAPHTPGRRRPSAPLRYSRT